MSGCEFLLCVELKARRTSRDTEKTRTVSLPSFFFIVGTQKEHEHGTRKEHRTKNTNSEFAEFLLYCGNSASNPRDGNSNLKRREEMCLELDDGSSGSGLSNF